MQNFGFTELRLVRPCAFDNDACRKLALFAYSIVENALIFDTLEEALQPFSLSIGFTRRKGKWRRLDGIFHNVLKDLHNKSPQMLSQTALIFGNEGTGLSQEDSQRCSLLVELPTHPTHGSMNLAHAVTCACYELIRSELVQPPSSTSQQTQDARERNPNLLQKRRRTLESIDRLLEKTGFYEGLREAYIQQRVEELLERSLLNEVDLTTLQKFVEKLRILHSSEKEPESEER